MDLPDRDPKATVLFTHCFTCNKDLKAIVRISRGLASRGFRVLRYDLTGLGGSQGDFSLTNFTTNRADLKAAAAFLSHSGVEPQFLLGHSFGAACSLSVAQELPSIIGVGSIAAPSDTQHLATLLTRMNSEISVRGIGTVSIGGREYVIRSDMLDDFNQHDLTAELRRLTKPAILFHSPIDETLGYEHVLRIFAGLTQRAEGDPDPAATSLITLANADHLLVRNPADVVFVADTLAAWFDRQLAGDAGSLAK